jgi:hypothetical protein
MREQVHEAAAAAHEAPEPGAAVPARPLGAATPERVLRLSHLIGNAGVARALASGQLQRQPADAKRAELAQAVRAAAGLADPEVMEPIVRRLDEVGATKEERDAAFMTAGFRGLALPSQVSAYVSEAWGVMALIPTYKGFAARAKLVLDTVNRRLVAVGVPPMAKVVRGGWWKGSPIGEFLSSDWAMLMHPDLERDQPDYLRTVMAYAYHEARHAEQSWLVTRLATTTETNDAVVARSVGVPVRIVRLARNAPPLTPGEARLATRIRDDPGAAARKKLAGELVPVIEALQARKAAGQDVEAELSAVGERFTRDVYRAQPHERDAWFVQDALVGPALAK